MRRICFAIITTVLFVSSASAQDWYNTSPQQTNLDAEDQESGVDATYYCSEQIDNETYECDPQGDGNEYSSGQSISISREGINYFRYFSEDRVGNDEPTTTRIFRLDLTDPKTTSNYSETWENEPVTVDLSCEDPENPNASGCNETYLCKEGSCPLDEGTSATFDTEGVSLLRYRSTDVAGNNEDVNTQDVKLDFTPPRAFVETAPTVDGRNATAECEDELSGCNETTLRLDVSVRPIERCSTDSTTYNRGPTYSPDQHVWVCAAVKDNAGNWGYSDQPVVVPEEEGDPIAFNKDKIEVVLGGSSTATFRVLNIGNLAATYEVTVEQDTQAGLFSGVRGRPETFEVELDPEQSKEFDLEVSGVRDDIDDGEDVVTVRTDDPGSENSLAEGSDKLEVDVMEPGEPANRTGSSRSVPGIAPVQIAVLLTAASALYFTQIVN
jgi:hypothetical protein